MTLQYQLQAGESRPGDGMKKNSCTHSTESKKNKKCANCPRSYSVYENHQKPNRPGCLLLKTNQTLFARALAKSPSPQASVHAVHLSPGRKSGEFCFSGPSKRFGPQTGFFFLTKKQNTCKSFFSCLKFFCTCLELVKVSILVPCDIDQEQMYLDLLLCSTKCPRTYIAKQHDVPCSYCW